MADIKQVNGRTTIDYMSRDYDSLLRSMRDLVPDKLPEWKDFESEADFGNVLLELFAHMGDILSYYQDRIANESFLGTAQTRRSIIHHLRLIGYRLSTAAPAAANLILTVPAACNDRIVISKGDAFATKSQKDKKSVRFEYTSETSLEINCADFPNDPTDPTRKVYATNDPKKAACLLVDPNNPKHKVYAAILPVEEGRLIKDEILGLSDGTPNQRFTLAHAGVILRSFGSERQENQDILLDTEQGNPWTLRETLAFSRNNQRDFTMEIDEYDRGTVVFGDGAFGFIPSKGQTIKVTYRIGGGKTGNVAENTIQTIIAAPQLILLGAKVRNPVSASGGADRENIEHAVTNAPRVFRSLKRAVTVEDYEALALDFNGVVKVRAEAADWNTVTLFIAPEGGGRVSDALEANLLTYFEDKRPLSTVVEIADVDYIQIYLTVSVGVTAYYSPADIKAQVKAVAANLLALQNVDFGRPIFLSKFYEAIESIVGVEYVNITEFRRQEQAAGSIEPRGKIELGPNELPVVPNATENPNYAGGIWIPDEGG